MKEAIVIVLAIAVGCLAGHYFTLVKEPSSPHPAISGPAEESANPADAATDETVAASSVPDDSGASAAVEEDDGEAPRIISSSTILGRSAPTGAPAIRPGSRHVPRIVPSLPQPRPSTPPGRC